MGTRHLIGVVLDGDFKIAQYGQWDGYPSGQGATIRNFLTSPNLDIVRFIENVRKLRWITDEETAVIEKTENWPKEFPWMSRDAGAEILLMVYSGQVPYVGDGLDFALDGLFCEYAYVIDLDGENPTLEVYTGFHKEGEAIKGRWANADPKSILEGGGTEGYLPVSLLKTYELAELPSEEDFVAELEALEAVARGEEVDA